MFATRKARLAAVCLLLTAVATCDRKHDSQDFLPSAPAFQEALKITNPPGISLPADGLSTVKIEAQISPDANVSRIVRFETTLGGWLETEPTGGAAAKVGARRADLPQLVDKDADNAGKAAAVLQSSDTEGVALVTVSVIKEDGTPLVSVTRDVPFTRVSEAISLTATPESVLADGVATVTLEARISAGSPAAWDEVTFETTLGALNNSEPATPPTPVTVPADGSRIARAELRSSTSGTATVTAKIKDFTQAFVTRLVVFTATERNISISPQSLAFGPVTVNSTSDLVLLISNTGSAPLKVEPFEAPANTTFTVQNAPAAAFTITPGGTRPITVRFQPVEAGEQSGILYVSSDDPQNRLVAVELTGEGVLSAPTISVEPPNLAFGQVAEGATSDLVVTVINTGSGELVVPALVQPTNTKFKVTSPTSEFKVAPGGTQPVTVRFEPGSTSGAQSGVLNITSNDPVRPLVAVPLTGEGVKSAPNIVVEPASLAFGQVKVNTTSDLVLVIRNTGSAPLKVETLVAPTNTKFKLPNPPAAAFDIAAGGTRPITVRFEPGATVGAQTGVLNITSNDPQDPLVAVPLTGEGIP